MGSPAILTTLYLPLASDPDKTAKVTIQIVEDPLGAMDRPHCRVPTIEEVEAVTDALRRRAWRFLDPNQ